MTDLPEEFTRRGRASLMEAILQPLRRELTLACGERWLQPGDEHPDFVLSGSAMLALHGLRDPTTIGDIDLFVTPRLWGALVSRGWGWSTPRAGDPPMAHWLGVRRLPWAGGEWQTVQVDAWFEWDARDGRNRDGIGIVERAFMTWERRRGWPVMNLVELLEWKRQLCANCGRGEDSAIEDLPALAKHCRDAAMIETYLEVLT